MKKGSITVYVCLTFCVILSLIYVCIGSVRTETGKAAAACSVDEGLFSLFSNYDKTLFDDYGMLFLDAGYGGSGLKIGTMADEVTECMEDVLSPDLGILGTTPESLYRINMGNAEVTGYVLATDMNYQRVREQIKEVIGAKIGTDVLSEIGSSTQSNADILEKYKFDDNTDMEDRLEEYEADKENAEALSSQNSEDSDAGTEETQEVSVPENFENPLDNANTIASLGLYDFLLPQGKSVSNGTIDLSSTVSHRQRNSGMGEMPQEEHESYEKIMLSEFGIRFFSNFLSEESSGDLKYQAEYMIAGQSSDEENLRRVLDSIVLIREGMNYLYLYTDAGKMSELAEISLTIAMIILSPEYQPVIQQALMLLWAYAESLMDVKTLLAGGKIPVFKDQTTWQLSLANLGKMNSSTGVENKGSGLSYKEYLRLLMYMQSDQNIIDRTMDMLEYSRRSSDENSEFCLDSCVSDFQIQYSGTIAGTAFSVNRSYGY